MRACPVAVRVRPWSPFRLVARLADAARSDRADRGSNPHEPTNPGVAELLTRPPQELLAAAGLRPVHMRVRIPPPGPLWGGHSRRGRRRVVSAGVRVRVPLSSPKWARRSTAGSLVCTQETRVRVPPGPPLESRCGGKGRRPWRSHKPRHAGSIPASATNGRFVQRKDGGLTSRSWGFDSLIGYHVRW